MKHDEFVGDVQHRLELASRGEAIRATRAVLETLGERLQADEAADLAGPLPMEIDRFLHAADSGQLFDFDEYVARVSQRARVEPAEAAFYAKVVVDVVEDAVPDTELDDVTAQLPAGYDELFELLGDDSYY
ncbi:uncharacterized protein (DUF2267 family) [Halarchaeum rubridurum]|uniref:Uncharacterized protein (DUF2267 family) n=1 Tax=Halarchaeum rubridurum TaxID=489911 RepID=A0A830FXY4_9EURY|nr:DUF2267 domain-containing protein [Halarchaeum rubridurum]MBP1953643.1 uncharacterized protein (DUF2267 family) [Halarchaeum rubridurum]GGM63729.1 hypothetical protein GCM10009017_12210 [Halarchaeum rubridurum]